MADTQRTRAAILTLFADNAVKAISEQDLRDYVVTVMETEFVNPGDFWKAPEKANVSSDASRGWLDYNQEFPNGASIGNVLYMISQNEWGLANAAASANNPALGVAVATMTSGTSGQVLRAGLVHLSIHSANFSGNTGKAVYLLSGAGGSITITAQSNAQIIGYVEDDDNGVWRFDPTNWTVTGT